MVCNHHSGLSASRRASIINHVSGEVMTNTDRATTVSLGGDACPSGIENWELPGLIVEPDSGPSDFVSPKPSCQAHQELELPSAFQSNITVPHPDHEPCVYCHDFFL